MRRQRDQQGKREDDGFARRLQMQQRERQQKYSVHEAPARRQAQRNALDPDRDQNAAEECRRGAQHAEIVACIPPGTQTEGRAAGLDPKHDKRKQRDIGEP